MKIINLLPKARQKELYFERLFHKLVFVLWLSGFSFLAVLGAQMATRIYLQREADAVVKESENIKSQVSKSENEQLKKTIKSYNDYIADYKNLSASPKWSKVLEAFADLPPENTGITSLVIDLKNKSININGFAATREDVIELYDRIQADADNFYGVDYPLENVAKPVENRFHFTFFIKDELLK